MLFLVILYIIGLTYGWKTAAVVLLPFVITGCKFFRSPQRVEIVEENADIGGQQAARKHEQNRQ